MAGIDLNRTTAGVSELLPRSISQDIWGAAVEESAIMSASRRMNLPGGGVTIPIITGEPTADWVNETDEKPVSRHTVGSKNIQGYTLAVIEPFSNQFRRDLPGLYAELARRLPFALARKFDQTIMGTTAPGSNFDTLGDAAAVEVAGDDVVEDLASVLQNIGTAGGNLSHWLISPQLEGTVRLAKDPGTGSYAFLQDARTDGGTIGSIFGRPVQKSGGLYVEGTPNQLGLAGDFANSATVGVVEDISVSLSDQASINDGGTVLHLWQRNMFALRVEVELGFAVRDKAHFNRLVGAAA